MAAVLIYLIIGVIYVTLLRTHNAERDRGYDLGIVIFVSITEGLMWPAFVIGDILLDLI